MLIPFDSVTMSGQGWQASVEGGKQISWIWKIQNINWEKAFWNHGLNELLFSQTVSNPLIPPAFDFLDETTSSVDSSISEWMSVLHITMVEIDVPVTKKKKVKELRRFRVEI